MRPHRTKLQNTLVLLDLVGHIANAGGEFEELAVCVQSHAFLVVAGQDLNVSRREKQLLAESIFLRGCFALLCVECCTCGREP